ncbi:agmatine deiminase family protein [Marinilabilia sp.]|uniref:agmatine deiminase family protein n=1 Tax=Marinilabilia sp. TaxID=2021252 RepID=UPI0025C2DED3|nr:agmatine deiminase family protein [Marinilabilia sp.]
MTNRQFPAEWANQDGVLLAWPHINTDWADMLDEAQSCFIQIINAIAAFEKVIVLIPENETLPQEQFGNKKQIHFVEYLTNDTWARDFGPLFVKQNNALIGLDYKFNGWGLKFSADRDNLITTRLFEKGIFNSEVARENHLSFVLEGGSIESDGEGTLLTTTECLMSPNRNGSMSKENIETELKRSFGAKRVLWLDYGYLSGDDTDSHVDTLARFCNADTIAYVKCANAKDEHFPALKKMEEQLRSFKTSEKNRYNLVPLPMADAIYDGEHRLPATYANFLILNKAVLVPFYNSSKDEEAINILAKAFPERQIIGIDCRPLIKQNGSLHCVTMQLPEGTLSLGL